MPRFIVLTLLLLLLLGLAFLILKLRRAVGIVDG